MGVAGGRWGGGVSGFLVNTCSRPSQEPRQKMWEMTRELVPDRIAVPGAERSNRTMAWTLVSKQARYETLQMMPTGLRLDLPWCPGCANRSLHITAVSSRCFCYIDSLKSGVPALPACLSALPRNADITLLPRHHGERSTASRCMKASLKR